VQVQRDSRVLILVEEAQDPQTLDSSEWEQKLQRAEEEISSCEEGSQQRKMAERDKRRAEAFLEIIRGTGS
jgi:F-type H+-transporting ATPase subunit epsilon